MNQFVMTQTHLNYFRKDIINKEETHMHQFSIRPMSSEFGLHHIHTLVIFPKHYFLMIYSRCHKTNIESFQILKFQRVDFDLTEEYKLSSK